MNEVIRQLFERKSVRVFTDRQIDPADKALILDAAAQAPTAGNQQLYTILDITDQTIKEQLVRTCDNQPFIAQAKLVLIFCADCLKWHDAFRLGGCQPRNPGVGDLLLAVSDAVIAAQNAVVAAQSLGIGSCYIGDIMENYEAQKALLQLPDYVFPAAMVVFGYPTEQQLRRSKPQRHSVESLVHENGYDMEKSSAMDEMLATQQGRSGDDLADWIVRFCNRKWNSEFSREMSRSCTEIVKSWCEE